MIDGCAYSFDEREFKILKDKICSNTDFDPESYKDACIRRRIFSRMNRTACCTLREYNRFLDKNPDEYDLLLKMLTINLTSFFRNLEVFNFLRQNVLSEIILRNKKRNNRRINIWNVACSTGEEPYSIAIILKEMLGLKIKSFKISILATDIDSHALKLARDGIFMPDKVRNMDTRFVKKYFFYKNNNFYIKSAVKNMIKFKKQDILLLNKNEKLYLFDLVMCRNLFIYFAKEKQEMIFQCLSRVIKKGGYLVLGKSETMIRTSKYKFKSIVLDERIYQRT